MRLRVISATFTACVIAFQTARTAALEYPKQAGHEIWRDLPHSTADCLVKEKTVSFGKRRLGYPYPKVMETCFVVDSFGKTSKGGRGQFITVSDFHQSGVEGYISFFLEVNCEDLEERQKYFWNIWSKKPSYTSSDRDTASKWWYRFREDKWSEWTPVVNAGSEFAFLCEYRKELIKQETSNGL